MHKEAPKQVADGLVVSLDYAMTVDEEVMESTAETEPIQFVQGEGQILPALEEALYGMAIGETKIIPLPAAEAYGEVDPASIHKANQDEFAIDIPLKVGTFL
ncbi:MAG: FKBP-type peptidyl-prolyl cis-trans isomerase, partial [Chloroflexota bacterium]|nr:FKBP-type peptidyl-prolyl cis-trans isomerase [Chloroflexota bacterium]